LEHYQRCGLDSPDQEILVFANDTDLGNEFRVTSLNFGESNAAPLGSLTSPLKISLNQPAAILPGTADCQRVYYDNWQDFGADGIQADLENDVDDAANEHAESVTVSIDSTNKIISLTPVLAAGSSTDDHHVIFGFGGLFVMPLAGPHVGDVYYVNNDFSGTGNNLEPINSSCNGIFTWDNLRMSNGNSMDNLALMQN
jgi:hypothetical protein